MTRTGFAVLEFDPKLNLSERKKLRDGLSTVLRIGDTLWVANDETLSVERLTYRDRDAQGVHRYRDHLQFPLGDYLRLPAPPPPDPQDMEEADVEGLDCRDGYLWLMGSHSLKRKKPEEGEALKKNLKRLAKVSSDANRYLLARIPLVEENGSYTLKKTAMRDGKRLVAGVLHGDDKGNDLIKAMRGDKHLEPFLAIPGKDNGVDFEGLAVLDNRLFIGLRGPVLRGWAIILELELAEDADAPSTLRLKKIGPDDCPYRKHFLQLGGLGIRDLCVRGSDLLILAGPTMDLDGAVTVLRWPDGAQAKEESCLVFYDSLETILDIPMARGKNRGTDHAEGMALFPPEGDSAASLLVVYDSAGPERKRGEHGVEADIFPLKLSADRPS